MKYVAAIICWCTVLCIEEGCCYNSGSR